MVITGVRDEKGVVGRCVSVYEDQGTGVVFWEEQLYFYSGRR